MLCADVVVVEALRLLLRKLQDFSRPLGEFVEAISHVMFHPVPVTEPTTRTYQTIATATRTPERLSSIALQVTDPQTNQPVRTGGSGDESYLSGTRAVPFAAPASASSADNARTSSGG